jgi:hypothetical protein
MIQNAPRFRETAATDLRAHAMGLTTDQAMIRSLVASRSETALLHLQRSAWIGI